MDQKLAVLFMPDDMTLTKEQAPLMLRPILFCPILTWMVEELMGRGIERFFIVSDKRAHDMMRPTSLKTPMLSTSTVPDTGKSS